MPTLPWNQIDTVLLDMDGTLLDLHYDNHFWTDYLPQKLAHATGLHPDACKAQLMSHYARVSGQIQWYCLDYWATQLNLDILAAKREIAHLISLRPDTIAFLDALKQSGRDVVLVTNSHPDGLTLKIERTQLDAHIDTLISTHEFGVTKESQSLWQQLHHRLKFDPDKTLFVDDSLPILTAAREFGIAHLLAVANPDSQQPVKQITDFPAVTDYRDLIEAIISSPVQHAGTEQ
ncbi:GMP/IMP nucleotidase [Salinimonas chungwhensis]|uniref:GMP/IMP nucleotidase n=1 Tax=Salinimonas chungwhensis TaxID=265425 RepID=UPI00037398A8|nr:GMP/IMP nucleotidase [Salinimonas chungwhensis]